MSESNAGPTVFEHPALVFAEVSGFRPLELDLHLPESATALPVILFVHGGGWRLGSRRVLSPEYKSWSPGPFTVMAQKGFAVISVDYRLSAEAVFPAQLHDVTAALTWLGQHSAEFGLDPNRVVLWGESAGGHLAALTALTADIVGVTVVGVVDWYGPSNLSTMNDQQGDAAPIRAAAPDSRETQLIGGVVGDNELTDAASPVRYVHPAAPPFFLAHGTADRFVPPAQSQELLAALTNAGVPAELHLIEGADHMWMGVDPTEILYRSLSFAQRVTTPAS